MYRCDNGQVADIGWPFVISRRPLPVVSVTVTISLMPLMLVVLMR